MSGRPVSKKKQKMWTTIRKLGQFTFHDIVIICGVSAGNAQSYISKLHSAGYLRIEGKSNEGTNPHKANIYRLIKDTGIYAPYEVSVIYDPNLKRVVLNERDLRGKDKE